jgi:hypothetical protein
VEYAYRQSITHKKDGAMDACYPVKIPREIGSVFILYFDWHIDPDAMLEKAPGSVNSRHLRNRFQMGFTGFSSA